MKRLALLLLLTTSTSAFAQGPPIENCFVVSGEQFLALRYFVQLMPAARQTTPAAKRILDSTTQSVVVGPSGSGFVWTTDKTSGQPRKIETAGADEEREIGGFAKSGALNAYAMAGGVEMVTLTETRQVSQVVSVPVTRNVTVTVQTPTGPVQEVRTVTEMVQQTVTKTVPVTTMKQVVVSPPADQLNAVLGAIRNEPNETVRKGLERIVGARFAEQYPPSIAVPGAEGAIKLANDYRAMILKEAKGKLELASDAALLNPSICGVAGLSTLKLGDPEPAIPARAPDVTFTVQSKPFVGYWTGSKLLIAPAPPKAPPAGPRVMPKGPNP